MKWLAKALSGLITVLHDLFMSDAARQKAAALLQEAGQLAVELYPVVEAIAAATPNRTDDEIVACIKQFGLMGLVDATLPKTDVLHGIALAAARNSVASTVSSSLISMAIETAYQAYQANISSAEAQ